MHPTSDLTSFPITCMGKILSHGYLATGFLPVRITFPTLDSILKRPSITIPDRLLLETFESSISCHEASLIRDALLVKGDKYSSTLSSSLIALFSRYGCREVLTPVKLTQIITKITHYKYQIKPLAEISAIRAGKWASHFLESVHSWKTVCTSCSNECQSFQSDRCSLLWHREWS